MYTYLHSKISKHENTVSKLKSCYLWLPLSYYYKSIFKISMIYLQGISMARIWPGWVFFFSKLAWLPIWCDDCYIFVTKMTQNPTFSKFLVIILTKKPVKTLNNKSFCTPKNESHNESKNWVSKSRRLKDSCLANTLFTCGK